MMTLNTDGHEALALKGLNDVAPPVDDTLVPLLKEDMVPWEVLHQRYGPLLGLVHTLLGVFPNCDPYLEIWEPAFRIYNIMVPNFLNLPVAIFGVGGAPADVVGLGMYVASRTAECPYCSAHSCTFALRRGASLEKMAHALVGREGSFSAGELATVAVARSLARVPSELTATEREDLVRHFGPDRAEWIAMGIVMMGFLNKFMDTIGVELEAPTVAEVSATIGDGWSTGKAGRHLDPAARTSPPSADRLRTKLQILPMLPTALRLDMRWQRGVPGSWPAAGEFLRERTGHDFPVLSRIRHGRVIKSIASMLRESLDPATTVVGLNVKVLAGVIYAETVADSTLRADMRALAAGNGVAETQLDEAAQFALEREAPAPEADLTTRAALLLARAASPSPAEIDSGVVEACRRGGLSAAAIVELVTWLAVLQMLHRLSSYVIVD